MSLSKNVTSPQTDFITTKIGNWINFLLASETLNLDYVVLPFKMFQPSLVFALHGSIVELIKCVPVAHLFLVSYLSGDQPNVAFRHLDQNSSCMN